MAEALDLPAAPDLTRPLAPADLWAEADAETTRALAGHAAGAAMAPLFDPALFGTLLPTFRTHQGHEAWALLGPFITAARPAFGPGIRERFDAASRIDGAAFATSVTARSAIRARVLQVLGRDGMLLIPTAPGPAPKRSCSGPEMESYRNRALTLLSVAGHAGLAQLSLPLAQVAGAP